MNPEHKERLIAARSRQGCEAWNRWREEEPAVIPDLSGLDLPRSVLRRVNLSHADLTRSNLAYSDLSYANLDDATLDSCDIGGTHLTRVTARGTGFRRADFGWAILRGADLTGANLAEARFDNTVFGSTDLTGAVLADVHFGGPCALDPATVLISGELPVSFLRGCGWPEGLIDFWPTIAEKGIEFFSGFISYSHSDQSFARRLDAEMQARGIRVWRDEHSLLPGDDMMYEVDEAIRRWDKLLLCCSRESLTSSWVEREIDKAILKEKELTRQRGERVHVLIPLNLDGYLLHGYNGKHEDLLKGRLAADFTGWDSDDAKFKTQLESVIRAMRPGGGRPPPPVPKL